MMTALRAMTEETCGHAAQRRHETRSGEVMRRQAQSSAVIEMTPKGQRRSHNRQPVQAGASCNTACLRQPCACRLSTLGGHAATHQPQPVQRSVAICGNGTGLNPFMP